MRIGTRLLLTLLPVVAVVMTVYALWALRQREETVIGEARRSTEAYASALRLALDQAFEDLEVQAVQDILYEASLEPRIFRAQVYRTDGTILARPDSFWDLRTEWPDRLEAIFRDGANVSFYAEVDDKPVLTVLLVLHDGVGSVRGVLEVVQPLDVIAAENTSIRRRFLFNTLTLLLALTVACLLAVHGAVNAPLKRLVQAVQALGSGELAYRVPEAFGGREVSDLAREFNKMAASLESAHEKLVRESDERLNLERQMRQADQMSKMGRLAAGVAHEIAAPLIVISGRAELVSKRPDVGDEVKRNLRIITDQINRISNIVRRLLDFVRRPTPDRVAIDLRTVVDVSIELLEAELQRAGVQVICIGESPSWVMADRDQIHQALINIMLNAVQAMEEVDPPRQLTLRTTTIEHSTETGNGVVQLDILDTGLGISETDPKRIFEPFMTTKDQGTGLGLAVTKSIIEEHGGTITASNRRDGRGAQFSIVLQRTPAPGSSNV